MIEDIQADELYQLKTNNNHVLVDVRSPKEYQEATIPGSVNIPIFSDQERAVVGTIYKQKGPEAAKEKGLEIFSKKLPDFIREFKKIDMQATVFCWRGGMRSKTAATVLGLMGIEVQRLSGGIRAYREWTVERLNQFEMKPELFVLNGYTGSGKTILLDRLKAKGYPVIDLEKLAGHRGSIFGHIGRNPVNQRSFDFALLEKLLEVQQERFVFIEGESKRIGKVAIPDWFDQKKENSKQIFVHLPVEERVRNILDDYQPWLNPEQFKEAFHIIKKRLPTNISKELGEYLDAHDFTKTVELLLTYYYDSLYDYSTNYPESQKTAFTASNVEEAEEQLVKWVSDRYGSKVK